MYLGGNGINCEVEFTEDGAAMRCKTQLVGAPGSLAPLYPDDPTKGSESRFGRTVESEANVLGVVVTGTGIMAGAPYKVVDASHWIFAGTGLRNGDLCGTNSQRERCPGGASGHETD